VRIGRQAGSQQEGREQPVAASPWQTGRSLGAEQKAAVSAACERFVAETLKPRFLPEVRPTAFNYPVEIFGRWRGGKYSFVTCYRSGFPENVGEEFDLPFTRLDHREDLSETQFDVLWRRHTGQWRRQHAAVTLEEALRLIAYEGLLQPNL
jgi:hypothetical protein